MHALDGWLKAVRTDGLMLVRTRVAGPWGYAVEEPGDAVVFHFVAEGRAFVRRLVCNTLKGLQKIPFLNTIKYIFVFKEGLNRGSWFRLKTQF